MRKLPILPSGSAMSTATLRFLRNSGTRSEIGFSHQSISPLCSAAAAVAGSGITTHSTRSASIRLPPASHEPAPEPRARLRARRIVGEFFERGLGARNPFVLHETHGAAADIFGNLLERIGLCDALRHDEGDRRADLAERQQHLREWLLEHPLHVAIVDSRELLLDGPDQQAHLVARGPALAA